MKQSRTRRYSGKAVSAKLPKNVLTLPAAAKFFGLEIPQLEYVARIGYVRSHYVRPPWSPKPLLVFQKDELEDDKTMLYRYSDIRTLPVECLHLSGRILRVIAFMKNVRELTQYSVHDLLHIHGIGVTQVPEIRKALLEFNLSLSGEESLVTQKIEEILKTP